VNRVDDEFETASFTTVSTDFSIIALAAPSEPE